ncbi:hypothetical protein [Rhizobium laguerreae]|uniref:hypothetical protein n=1 Tax=Rhizobium laguerreae TaxID=1076926 RepID=UPI001C915481|nr:hypothetical protein [Rhizobium laguerreae]MBY3343447.1 hypothetical protein [Rhizobium laguerreae]MBY3350480.1 hypothetical protein [Rhizobium laguerreae]MBY3371585.1 hypothetical protein [Rhizobium laguerreae]MBY3426823.1 hypothetical protein [Rhizobium laguerreae]MBY3435331.1 hypothetical protein [Rhizobium laguerreae]
MLSAKAGVFIDLKAFGNCRDFWSEDACLPSCQTIRHLYPQLIASAPPIRPLFVTHRWDSPSHPDPSGWQLRALQRLAEDYHYHEEGTCFWYDFMSLPQRPRTNADNQIFSAGLNTIRHTVASCDNICLVSKTGDDHSEDRAAMMKRGWILFELFICRSNLKRPVPLYERENGSVPFGRDEQFSDTFPDLSGHAPLDSVEHLHAWLTRRGIECTNGGDLLFLSQMLYGELTRPESLAPLPIFEYGVPMRLSSQELISMEFRESTSLSHRLPEAYLLKREMLPHRWGEEPIWEVVIIFRPPLPPLDGWHDLADSSVNHMQVDWEQQSSPLYPGVRFALSPDGLRFRPQPR